MTYLLHQYLYLLEIEKKIRKLEDREIKIGKEMDDLFPTPVPLPRPKKSFYRKPKYIYQDPESTHNHQRL